MPNCWVHYLSSTWFDKYVLWILVHNKTIGRGKHLPMNKTKSFCDTEGMESSFLTCERVWMLVFDMRKGWNRGFWHAEVFESYLLICGRVWTVVFDMRKCWIRGFWHAEGFELWFLTCGSVWIEVFDMRKCLNRGFRHAEVFESWFLTCGSVDCKIGYNLQIWFFCLQ